MVDKKETGRREDQTVRIVHDDGSVRLVLGDCVEAMRAMPEACIDAVVCDPPYG